MKFRFRLRRHIALLPQYESSLNLVDSIVCLVYDNPHGFTLSELYYEI